MGKWTLQALISHVKEPLLSKVGLAGYQYRALKQISVCRTGKLGSHAQYCEQGHLQGVWHNSCRHRACPQCQGMESARWLRRQESVLLNSRHHHWIFTLPHELNVLWKYNRSIVTVKPTPPLSQADH